MPVYEYECPACGVRFSKFFRSQSAAAAAVACATCQAPGAQRTVSAFQVHQTLKTKLDNLDPTFDKQIDAAMRPHQATDPLNRIDLSFGEGRG
jgi:putative FmdB family regulatory protein